MHIHRPNADAAMNRLQAEQKSELASPKFCKDCDWHGFEWNEEKGKYRHWCDCPALMDMVTGQSSFPQHNRNTASLCGVGAKYWTPKQKKQK